MHDHRLVDLWRQYSQRTYHCGWIHGDRKEIFRFITWSNGLCGICQEILWAQRGASHGTHKNIRVRPHMTLAWDKRPMMGRRFR